MRRLFAPAVALALAIPGTAAAAPMLVRITVRVADDVNGARIVVVEGSAVGAGSGESVSLEAKECQPGSAYRVIGGAQTTAGGAFAIRELAVASGATYRIRWKNETSNTVLVRDPLVPAFVERRPRRVWRVHYIVRWPVLHGRPVTLQRKTTAGVFVNVRRARLVRLGSTGPGGVDYAASFRIPTRGLRLRVLAPAATGAPCYRAGAGPEFRS